QPARRPGRRRPGRGPAVNRLTLHRAAPGMTVQDLGRPGHAAFGLSRGGAVDRLALLEAAALLGQKTPGAVLELPAPGAELSVAAPCRLALTGAPMRAWLDEQPLAWSASHPILPGQRLRLGPFLAGAWGYVGLAGGIATTPIL